MAIYTKKGDFGKTGLADGKEIDKDDDVVEAYGTIDELNSLLGLVKSKITNENVQKEIERIQKNLFTIGVEIAGGKREFKGIEYYEIDEIEKQIDVIENKIPKLNHFIIPGGETSASLVHFARTVCRRCERKVVKVSKREKVRNEILVYLNRLSDFLFVLAREINYEKKIQDVEWKGKKLL
ncbi:MAG: cob(I)yrinic acid a,c-diamide adenosyltransferase [Candidatus ainarchaeum sp.]|nr:cob(I)yrinic acid a,c-diamide adenosyltransferase [Candidatus ainarchaeum sp.]